MIIEMRISPAYQIFIEVYWKNLKNAAMGDYEGQSVASLVAKSQLPTPPHQQLSFWVAYNALVAQYARLGCMRGCVIMPVFEHACMCVCMCVC